MSATINNMNPLKSSQRVAIVDILRAYTLLGVLIITYMSFKDLDSPHANLADSVLRFV